MYWVIVQLIAFALISAWLAPKPPDAEVARLEGKDVPTADADKDIPVAFGTVEIKGANIIWYGDPGTIPITSKSGK